MINCVLESDSRKVSQGKYNEHTHLPDNHIIPKLV